MWVQGTILNVCGSVLVNLAANLLKLAHNVEEIEKISPNKQESMIRFTEALKYGTLRQYCFSFSGSPIYTSKLYWRLGAVLFAAGSVINFLSLSMAAQSLLATLGGVQFVSNIFFARCILGEKVTRQGLLATGVIIVGLTVAVSFSDHASTRYTSSGLIALYDRTYVTFIVSVSATLILAESIYTLYTAREKAGQPLLYSSIVRPVTYSMVSATVGTQSVLQSKCLAELLRSDIVVDRASGDDLFANGLFYIVLTAFLVGMAFWLYRLNNALKLFDGLVIIPIIQVFWVTSAILQGGMYFKEFQEMKGHQSLLFLTGVTIVFFGVYLIATAQGSENSIPESPGSRTDDRICDPEQGDMELVRKRSDSNVMIITCIGSPFKCDRNAKKFGKTNSNSNSSKSSNYDGCDRYFEDFLPVQKLEEEDDEGENEPTGEAVKGTEIGPIESAHASEISSLLPVQRVAHPHSPNKNPIHFRGNAVTSPHAALSLTSLSLNGVAAYEEAHCPVSQENKAENKALSPRQINSKGEGSNFSPPPRKDVRTTTVHMRERSLSSCGLLEEISDYADDDM